MATSPTYLNPPIKLAKRIADSDSTNIVDAYDNSAGTKPVRIEALYVCTDNTADRFVRFYMYDGSISHQIGSKAVAQLSGTDGGTHPRVNIMATLGIAGADGVPVIWIDAGCKLQASMDAALASGKYLYIGGRVYTVI